MTEGAVPTFYGDERDDEHKINSEDFLRLFRIRTRELGKDDDKARLSAVADYFAARSPAAKWFLAERAALAAGSWDAFETAFTTKFPTAEVAELLPQEYETQLVEMRITLEELGKVVEVGAVKIHAIDRFADQLLVTAKKAGVASSTSYMFMVRKDLPEPLRKRVPGTAKDWTEFTKKLKEADKLAVKEEAEELKARNDKDAEMERRLRAQEAASRRMAAEDSGTSTSGDNRNPVPLPPIRGPNFSLHFTAPRLNPEERAHSPAFTELLDGFEDNIDEDSLFDNSSNHTPLPPVQSSRSMVRQTTPEDTGEETPRPKRARRNSAPLPPSSSSTPSSSSGPSTRPLVAAPSVSEIYALAGLEPPPKNEPAKKGHLRRQENEEKLAQIIVDLRAEVKEAQKAQITLTSDLNRRLADSQLSAGASSPALNANISSELSRVHGTLSAMQKELDETRTSLGGTIGSVNELMDVPALLKNMNETMADLRNQVSEVRAAQSRQAVPLPQLVSRAESSSLALPNGNSGGAGNNPTTGQKRLSPNDGAAFWESENNNEVPSLGTTDVYIWPVPAKSQTADNLAKSALAACNISWRKMLSAQTVRDAPRNVVSIRFRTEAFAVEFLDLMNGDKKPAPLRSVRAATPKAYGKISAGGGDDR
ncbi:hypothetical protein MKEN_00269500 [Mycena kentingensis (nom. inval.)]|nr:hypothetical protein MKEN_00269500 [Mycena kentingensis (nom. inval.)]